MDVKLEGVNASLEVLDDPPLETCCFATATVKRRGIDYILITDHWLTKDIESDPDRWGLKKIADRGDAWLLQIQ